MSMMTVPREKRKSARLLSKRITSTITTNANSSLTVNFASIPSNTQSVLNVSEAKDDNDTIKQVNSNNH